MDKSCKRCESEATLEGLPIGGKCLEALRDELRGYEEILSASEKARLEQAKMSLEKKIEPLLEELTEIETKLSKIEEAEKPVPAPELAKPQVDLDRIKELEKLEQMRIDNERLAVELAEADLLLETLDPKLIVT